MLKRLLFATLLALLLAVPHVASAQDATTPAQSSAPFVASARPVHNEPSAPDTLPFTLSLREGLEVGLQRNYDIRIVRNREQMARNNVTLGNAGFLPTAGISAGYGGTLNDLKQHPADGGPAVTADGIHNRNANAALNLGWTLFEGFSVQTSYQRLKELRAIGELGTRLRIETFVSEFVSEYYNYIRQLARLRNLKNTVALSRERLRIVEANYTIGSMSKLDLQQAQVDLNADLSQLMKQHEVLAASRTRINELLAARSVEREFTPADTAILYNPNLQREELLERALRENVYIKISRKEEDVSELDLKIVKSHVYPYLRFNGGYGYGGYWYDASVTDRQRTLGFNYGLTLGFTLFDGFNQRRLQRNARLEIENRDLELKKTEQGIRADLVNAWVAYRNNIELITLQQSNVKTAREYHEIAVYRYKLGNLSGIELREAQNSLFEAEERLVQALFDAKLCEVTLLQIAGLVMTYVE